MHNENIRIQPARSQRNTGMINQNNVRSQPAIGNRNNTRVEPTRRNQNNIRTSPQKQVQPQIENRSTENSGRRK